MALREAAIGYILDHGLSDLSLRPLAKAIGSSPKVLLYFFGSKEELIVDAVNEARLRQQKVLAGPKGEVTLKSLDELWRFVSSPQHDKLFRLFFEIYGLALQKPGRYQGLLKHVVSDWLGRFKRGLPRVRRRPSREVEELATLAIAVYRGLLLDLLATADKRRVNRTFRRFTAMIRSRIGRER